MAVPLSIMWKMLILQASRSPSDELTEALIKVTLSFMRFLGP
ncbi:transposase [Hyphomicrobiales bacterium BP6-180914]|uniref:Transposase n=1 Tax=Lichenifustis flavocetrariae TaxID=2949735 RepID=A0AA41YZK1_9HYPH|nr:transposase [Lichenifustis flavocetrariae]MCW6511459.1 transposase [Lichenifustis flavocetrariae]